MEKTNIEKTERCVGCGKDTGIPVTKNIYFRSGYVEGAGQLCTECFEKTYKKIVKNNDD